MCEVQSWKELKSDGTVCIWNGQLKFMICQSPSVDRVLSFVDHPDQMTSSQSQLAGPDGKAEQSKENNFVDFSKVNPCRTMTLKGWMSFHFGKFHI